MNQKERKFIETVNTHWRENGRHGLPWRKTTDPYLILVSEVMLQQTQVDRVLPKYTTFIKRWPTAQVLARAPLGEVLQAWQGLGYNSRAKRLHETVRVIAVERKGVWPQTYEGLQQLPGIGPYTAGAVLAFAFNQPVPIIETNIRTVFLYHFFKNQTDVADAEVLTLVTKTLDQKNPREWYWALMDYGAHLKKVHGNPNVRSRSYAKQSKFQGSDRQIRGALVRAATNGTFTRQTIHKQLEQFDPLRIDVQLERLLAEEMLIKTGRHYALPQ